MKLYAPLLAVLLAVPAFAQTDSAVDMEAMSTAMGPAFYSDDGMVTLRTPEEVKANFTAMSDVDKEALRVQCGLLQTDGAGSAENSPPPADTTAAPVTETTDGAMTVENSEAPDTAAAPVTETTDGAMSVENSTSSATNFVADPVRLRAVCDMIAGL